MQALNPMASKFFSLLLFLLFLSTLFLKVSSVITKSERARDYDNWISWHVNKFQNKYEMVAKTQTKEPAQNGRKVLDVKLKNAEVNKVTINVSQDGTGDFQSIKKALDSIPLHNKRRVILFIKPGVYSDPPTITGNDTASKIGSTYGTATVAVNADYFVAIDMKFENTARHMGGSVGQQAVALRISGSYGAFYNCSFYGTQDTLYDQTGLHYFSNCFIQGSVDFICGHGQSLYENCNLHSIATEDGGALTAQKRTASSMDSGFSFKDCKVTGSGQIYLGRAWGDYSRVIFSYTYMDNIVLREGWNDWNDPKRESTVYYGEYKCSGPGANFTRRVPWARLLTDKEAEPFLGTNFINGDTWLINPYEN